MNKNSKRIFYVFLALYAIMILYIFKFAFFDSKSFIANSYNARLNIIDTKVVRGEIKDNQGEVLVRTIKQGNANVREYVYGREFSHVLGYIQPGKYGLDGSYNLELQKLHLEIIQRVKQIASGSDLKGNNIVTTLDSDLQKLAFNQLGNQKGAIVIMEPQTGKILAMVSYPNFNPNTLSEYYQELNSDHENTPLFNRGAQGSYVPGSVFKIVTQASAIQNLPDWDSYVYHCDGVAVIGSNEIRCAGGTAHGDVDYQRALAVSCNGYFAHLGEKLGGENLMKTAESFYFNKTFGYPLQYSIPSFVLTNDSDTANLTETAIGQGKTLTSPLHMALIGSSIANGGVMMKPYILDHIEYPGGGKGKQTIPQRLDTVLDVNTANIIKDMMVKAVDSGTGQRAQISGVAVAGKTGTAQNPSGNDHAWFVGFAPADDPKVCVAIILENAGSGSNAAAPAKKLMEKALAKYN